MFAGLPQSEAEIDRFIAAFEQCTLPKESWTHGAHLLTGACYVYAFGVGAATDRMRERVSAFNLSVGGQNTATSGYHETVTVLWIRMLGREFDRSQSGSRAAFAHDAVERFALHREILREFYDFGVVASTEARARWIPPNLQSLG